MDQRRALACRVLEDGVSVRAAALEFGVSRPTAHLWVSRARDTGVARMREASRRPAHSPGKVEQTIVEALLAAKRERPHWGAKKLLEVLWPGGSSPICLASANRILRRHGLVGPAAKIPPDVQRFERGRPNELWQMDFKGLGRRPLGYEVLSVLDDCTRFCIALVPVKEQTVDAVWRSLWSVFESYGLPERILSDNGHCFASTKSSFPGQLEGRLWRLGVATSHGRPCHPQTQGKVERFHRTMQLEIGDALRQPTMELAEEVCAAFRQSYNWQRPHEAIEMRVPGSQYRRSERERPSSLPGHQIPEASMARVVDASGVFSFGGRRYRAGHGLAGERVEIRAEGSGHRVYYAGVLINEIEGMRV